MTPCIKYSFYLLAFLFLNAGVSEVNAQDPIILDRENAPHVIEISELESVNKHGAAFSLIEYGENYLWVSYDRGTSAASSYVMSNKQQFYLKKGSRHSDADPVYFRPGVTEKSVIGPSVHCSDNQLLFLTANQDSGWQGRTQLGVFVKDLSAEETRLVPLPFMELRYNYLHPAWDAENERLYFSSDKGGSGRSMSLYYTEKISGGWTSPQLLGDNVNSNHNDVFAHWTPEGLLFSSDRPGGSGNLDLYFAAFKDGEFSAPQRLPEPFNSGDDDFGIWIDREGRGGYLSSNREGRTDRIYQFDCRISCFLPATVRKTLEVTTISSEDGTAIRDAKTFLIPERVLFNQLRAGKVHFDPLRNQLNMDLLNALAEEAGVVECITNREGKCLMESQTNERRFFVFVQAKGAQSVLQDVEFGPGFDHQVMDISMERDCSPTTINLYCPEGEEIIEPKVWIENVSSGVVDTLQPDNGAYSVCLQLNNQFYIFASAEDRHSAREIVSVQTPAHRDITLQIEPEEVEVVREGTVLELENIYYEYNSHLITEGAASELDELAAIMKMDTSMVIELRAHTDSRGSELYNLQLSQRRANSAMEYLVTVGIARERIRTAGFGETQLRNHCRPGVQCTEEEHAHNRRTEVAVLQAGEGVRSVRGEDGQLRFTIYR